MNKEHVSFLLACCLVACQLTILYNIWDLGFSSIIFNYTLLPVVASVLYCIANIPGIIEKAGTQIIGFCALFEVSIVVFVILTGGVVFGYLVIIMILEIVSAILAIFAAITAVKYNKLK